MPVFIIFPFIFILLTIVITVLLWGRHKKIKQKKRELKYLQDFSHLVPKNSTYTLIGKDKIYQKDIRTNSRVGKKLSDNINSLYFVHGTFVGEDPFHFFELIDIVVPEQFQHITSKLKSLTKVSQSLVTGDLANYTQKHVDTMGHILKNVEVKNFSWSSGNHHYARVKGALNLAKELSVLHHKGDRVLLFGHSHAAQLFALLTQFIEHDGIEDIINEHFSDLIELNHFKQTKNKLKHLHLDFVTFGSPPRYEWIHSEKARVLHFINHRMEGPKAGHLSGVLTTRDGDYIQQIGLTGSDFTSPIEKENIINKELDSYFGPGANRQQLKDLYKKKQRLHNLGHHFLLDYGDNGKIPNCALTVFGHGIYTKVDLLDFHLEEVVKKFYQEN